MNVLNSSVLYTICVKLCKKCGKQRKDISTISAEIYFSEILDASLMISSYISEWGCIVFVYDT